MEILASERFLKAYHKGSLVVQQCAEGAVHDFVRRYRSGRENTSLTYGTVKGMYRRVLEIDMSGSGRILAFFENDQLTLLDVGGKRIVPSYDDRKLDHDLVTCTEAPAQFWPEQPVSFFSQYPDPAIQIYGTELSADWVYWLDEEQGNVLQAIEEDLLVQNALLYDQKGKVFLIAGGPGTGKSCILLNLLKYYVEQGFAVGLHMAEPLVEYVEKTTHAGISQYLLPDDWLDYQWDVVLLDDPDYLGTIKQYADQIKARAIKLLVVAVDPLQMDESITDSNYRSLIKNYRAEDFTLTTCYRQKQNVGQTTQHAANVIAASSAYLAEGKVENYRGNRTQLTKLANDLVFRNPHGYTNLYRQATVQHVRDEINRIYKPSLLWPHGYNLLAVEPSPGSLHSDCYELMHRVRVKIIAINEIKTVKGLEFQHVFLFLERIVYEQVEHGFQGSGRAIYEQRRLLRIPFSRAKDSLVTFVLED